MCPFLEEKHIIWYIFIVAQKFFIFFSNSKAHVFLGKMFSLRGAALKNRRMYLLNKVQCARSA